MTCLTSTIDCSVLSVFRLSLGQRGRPRADCFKMADFQRPFVWTQENILKILDDVDELRSNPSPSTQDERDDLYDIDNAAEYFLGSICLRCESPKDDRYYEVLDGQQRLTSLLILAYVIHEQVQRCKNECIRLRWTRATKKLGDPSYWQNLLVFTNPQSKKRMAEIYWLFKRDYECLKRDADEDSDAPKTDGMSIFEQTLYRDVQRFEYILQKGRFAVLILKNLTEAEQFFQGENNRGLPMTMLDLLKAYHMRQETEPNRLKQIGEIWQRLGLTASKPDNETKSFQTSEVEPSNRWLRVNPDWTSWLMSEFVLPAMLLQYGIAPWSAVKLENLGFLKGVVGTHTGDSFIDEKIEHQGFDDQSAPLFDLRAPVRPGLPFFQEIEQYLKIAQAIDVLLWEPKTDEDRKTYPYAGASLVWRGLSVEGDRFTILKLALIAWADRFLKAGIMRSDCTWVDVAAALAHDGAFRVYGRNFAHFLNRLAVKDETKNGDRIGAYKKLQRVTFDYALCLSEPEYSLLFLPHRSSSRSECLMKLKASTHPNTVRLKTNYSHYREGYWNSYLQEFNSQPTKENGHE